MEKCIAKRVNGLVGEINNRFILLEGSKQDWQQILDHIKPNHLVLADVKIQTGPYGVERQAVLCCNSAGTIYTRAWFEERIRECEPDL